MTAAKLALVAFAATACSGARTTPERPSDDPLAQPESALLGGTHMAIAYSGYRHGQHPDRGGGEKAPSDAELLEDLQILLKDGNFGVIRLYDSGEVSQRVLKIIADERLPMKVMLGAWLKAELSAHETCAWLTEPIPDEVLAANAKKNSLEVDRAIALAKRYADIVVAVNVGNEALVTWNDHLVSIDSLLGYAKRVKAAIQQPVTTADNYVVFRDNGTRLAEVLDFFAVHTYPVWEGKTIDEGMSYTLQNLRDVRAAAPEVPIVIGEAGWPSVAVEFEGRASPATQKRYFDALMAWADAHHVTTFYFEAYDEPWKGDPASPLGAEKHWGVFDVARRAKLVMKDRYPERARPERNPSVVTVEPRPGGEGYVMTLNGEPYRAYGVGGLWNLDLAKALGANSIRTWGADAWLEAFDEGERLGMTVFAGIWLSHYAKDYEDEAYKAKKRAQVEALAQHFASHPNLLVWCLGNELQLSANTESAWKFVEELAQIIRKYDQNHPIATATAHSPPEVLNRIAEHAPSVTMLAVNSYAGLPAVQEDIDKSRFKGAWLLTEWGPNGHWETAQTKWGRPIEQLSAEKVGTYRDRSRFIEALPDCVGSYVFLWGNKVERTSTWYSMFVEVRPELGLDGEATGAVDVVQKMWSGTDPENFAPVIDDIRIGKKKPADNVVLKAGKPFAASATATDLDGDRLTWVWELLHEPEGYGKHGQAEARPPRAKVELKVEGATASGVITEPGEYRLFAYALDGKGKVGTANMPLKVEAR